MKIHHSLISFSLFLAATLACAGVETGAPAPDFTLVSCEGKAIRLSDYKGRIVVLEWFNLGCPFVKKHYKSGDMQALQKDYTGRGVVWLCINSTNPRHRDFLTPERTAAQCKSESIGATAMLADPDGTVGRLYGAKSTPHMFIVGADGKLVYQGAIDNAPSPLANPRQADNFVKKALNELLLGKPVSESQTKQYGCGVKYAD